MKKTAEEIRKIIEERPEGVPFAVTEFLRFGSRTAVDKALSRLAKEGTIMRAAQGVYVRPERSQWVAAPVPPPLAKVVSVIAGRTGETLQVNGAEAANRLHLSTQMPMRPMYFTSGNSRTVEVLGTKVTLRRASPRKLMLAGTPAGVALSALWYLGRKQVTGATIRQIKQALPPKEFEALVSVAPMMPSWMAGPLHKHSKRTAHAVVSRPAS